MKQEDKDLLLRDLCSRLPYGVKVGTADNDGSLENVWDMLWYNTFTEDLKLTHSIEDADKIVNISETKPYLFPLSSMTEEQKYICPIGVGNLETFIEKESWAYLELSFDSILRFIDWINKNHFDYRGLIPKGLAIDCTNLNTY